MKKKRTKSRRRRKDEEHEREKKRREVLATCLSAAVRRVRTQERVSGSIIKAEKEHPRALQLASFGTKNPRSGDRGLAVYIRRPGRG